MNDIQPMWLNVVRRIQSVAKSDGCSIVRIAVVVDEAGVPILYCEPEVVKLEPKSQVRKFLSSMLHELVAS